MCRHVYRNVYQRSYRTCVKAHVSKLGHATAFHSMPHLICHRTPPYPKARERKHLQVDQLQESALAISRKQSRTKETKRIATMYMIQEDRCDSRCNSQHNKLVQSGIIQSSVSVLRVCTHIHVNVHAICTPMRIPSPDPTPCGPPALAFQHIHRMPTLSKSRL